MTTCLKLVFIWSSVWNFPNTRANASISNKLYQGLNTVNSFLIKSCVYWVQWWVFDKDAKQAAPCIWFLAMHLMPGHAFDAWASDWNNGIVMAESTTSTRVISPDYIGRQTIIKQQSPEFGKRSREIVSWFWTKLQIVWLWTRSTLYTGIEIDVEKVKSFTCWWQQQFELLFTSSPISFLSSLTTFTLPHPPYKPVIGFLWLSSQ